MLKSVKRLAVQRVFSQLYSTTSSSTSLSEDSAAEDRARLAIVLTHLPAAQDLQQSLLRTFNSSMVRVHYNVQGAPAYALVSFNCEKEYRAAAEHRKTSVEGAKVYVTVSAI